MSAARFLGCVGFVAVAMSTALADVPADEAPRYDAQADAVVCVASARRPTAVARLAAARVDARRDAERAAKAEVHRFIDGVLTAVQASPRVAAALHDTAERGGHVTATVPLGDGGMVVRWELPGAALRDVATVAGAPWSR